MNPPQAASPGATAVSLKHGIVDDAQTVAGSFPPFHMELLADDIIGDDVLNRLFWDESMEIAVEDDFLDILLQDEKNLSDGCWPGTSSPI